MPICFAPFSVFLVDCGCGNVSATSLVVLLKESAGRIGVCPQTINLSPALLRDGQTPCLAKGPQTTERPVQNAWKFPTFAPPLRRVHTSYTLRLGDLHCATHEKHPAPDSVRFVGEVRRIVCCQHKPRGRARHKGRFELEFKFHRVTGGKRLQLPLGDPIEFPDLSYDVGELTQRSRQAKPVTEHL